MYALRHSYPIQARGTRNSFLHVHSSLVYSGPHDSIDLGYAKILYLVSNLPFLNLFSNKFSRLAGRRGGLVAIAEIALFSHYCFGPENMNFSFVDEKSFAALKVSVLEVLVLYVYASVISLTIQDQVTRDMDAIIKTKSDFVTRMSHELRTPLTGSHKLTELFFVELVMTKSLFY